MAKYLKHDTEKGYIEDNAEIEYTQFNNLRHTILGCMMGDFDSQGRYIIAPEIRDELIQMPKYLVDSMENVDICASVLKLDKQLSFLVTYEGNRVTLSLMEKMSYESNAKLNSGSYSNIVEYLLDEIETSGVVNKSAVFSHWNISEFGGAALDVFNMDDDTIAVYFNVINRFKYLMVANKLLLKSEKELEEIEADYANKLFDILEGYPKLKAAVEKELKETLEEKKDFIRLDKPNFAKTLNEVIEKVIENNIGVLSEKQQEEFKAEKHIAQMDVNIRRREIVDIQTKPVEAENTIQLEDGESVDFVPEEKSTITIINTDHEEIKDVNEVADDLVQEEKNTSTATAKDAVKALLGDLTTDNKTESDREEHKETAQVNPQDTNKRLLGRIAKVKTNNAEKQTREQGGGETEAEAGAQKEGRQGNAENEKPSARQKLVDNLNRITDGNATVHVDDKRQEKVREEQQKREQARERTNTNTPPVYSTGTTPPRANNVGRDSSGGGGTDTGKGNGKGNGNAVKAKGQTGTKKTTPAKTGSTGTDTTDKKNNNQEEKKGTFQSFVSDTNGTTEVYYTGGDGGGEPTPAEPRNENANNNANPVTETGNGNPGTEVGDPSAIPGAPGAVVNPELVAALGKEDDVGRQFDEKDIGAFVEKPPVTPEPPGASITQGRNYSGNGTPKRTSGNSRHPNPLSFIGVDQRDFDKTPGLGQEE